MKLLLVPNPNHYYWVHEGVITADNMDDGEELLLTNVAFDVLGSSPEEKICVYKLTRGIMHLGTMKLKQKPREEQAEVDNTESISHIVPSVSVSKYEPKRYQSLNPSIIPPGSVNNKKASELLLGSTDLGEKEYITSIFLCAGIPATLEDMRDEPLAKIMTMLQSHAHGFLMRTEYKRCWKEGEAFDERGPKGEENVTEGTGAARHHVKDSGALRTCRRAEEQTATLSQENDRPIQLQAESYQQGMVKGLVFI
ncbi:myosin-15 [Grus japonensis]|uniref:Myosin-15 n=1 Tax=Grus japonensis TaxID=30415 RepID=A0ABC9XG07_GRUJA